MEGMYFLSPPFTQDHMYLADSDFILSQKNIWEDLPMFDVYLMEELYRIFHSS